MVSISDVKKKMGQALKIKLSQLSLPGELKKKVNSKMFLEANLSSGCNAIIACAEAKGGRAPGNYGLYLLLSLNDGPIYKIMHEVNLDISKSFSGNVIFSGTSHNLSPKQSHYEITPNIDFDEVASEICKDIQNYYFPIISAFDTQYLDAVNFIKNGGFGFVRNPFTMCVILLGLSHSLEKLDEIISIARDRKEFYDFHAVSDFNVSIVTPLIHLLEIRYR